jgi:hypothetical protein
MDREDREDRQDRQDRQDREDRKDRKDRQDRQDFTIVKYKNVTIDSLIITDNQLYYNNNLVLFQSCMIDMFEILHYKNQKYINVKINKIKINQLKFLTFIQSIECFLQSKYGEIRTSIINDIYDNKYIRFKILQNTTLFNQDKNIISILSSHKIIILFVIHIYKNYYTPSILQVLELY